MNIRTAKTIFEKKHFSEMNYEHYLSLLEEGSELLNNTNESITCYKQLQELKAIRIALEYRIEVIRQYRKKQLSAIGESVAPC